MLAQCIVSRSMFARPFFLLFLLFLCACCYTVFACCFRCLLFSIWFSVVVDDSECFRNFLPKFYCLPLYRNRVVKWKIHVWWHGVCVLFIYAPEMAKEKKQHEKLHLSRKQPARKLNLSLNAIWQKKIYCASRCIWDHYQHLMPDHLHFLYYYSYTHAATPAENNKILLCFCFLRFDVRS